MSSEHLPSKIYIIKMASKILGPYTVKEVIDQMWAKKIHAFDEVKTPFTRWSFLRDDEALGKVFKDIIEARANSDDANEVTTTIEKTAITVSEKLMKLKELSHHTASVVDADVGFNHYTEDAEDVQMQSSTISVISVKAGYKKQKRKTYRYLYLMILLVSIALFGTLLLEEGQQIQQMSVNSTLWDTSNYLGDTKTILSIYNPKENYNADTNYKFIEAYIHDDKFLEAEKILVGMSGTALPAKEKARVLNYQGVIELHRQNFETANAKFKEALELDPTFEEAQVNLVDGLLLVDDIQQAKAFLLDEIKLENAQSTSVYLHYETLFFDEKFIPEDDSWINEVFTHVNQPYDQRQEILILLGLLLLEKNYINESTQVFQRALDIDPEYLSLNYQTQSLYHPKVVIPKTLVFLKRFEFKYQGNPYYLAAISMLYHKSKSPILARKYLDQALRISPMDPYLTSMLQLFEPNFDETSLRERIITGQLTMLEAKLASKYCYKLENIKCADDIWNYILMTDPNNVAAITGKVQVFWQKNMFNEAKQWLYRGLGVAPRYIPLRKIEMENNL
jgi:tetratricopeptide (TPR) repeat protein